MKRLDWALICMAVAAAPSARADDAAALAVLRQGCTDDAKQFCANVQPGGGRILACLKEHKDSLSDKCKQAAQKASSMSGNQPANPPPASPPTGANSNEAPFAAAPAAAATSQPPAADAMTKHAAHATAPGGSGNAPAAAGKSAGKYLLLKKAQIKFAEEGKEPQPGMEMLIPTDWNLKGQIGPVGGSKSGCFSDSFPVSWVASNQDASLAFKGFQNYSWQYTDDPQEMRKLNDPNRRQRDGNGKVCPVSKPLNAEQFFRQSLLVLLPSDTKLLSVEPDPELNEVARQQMGLGPNDSSGNVRTDAVRARVEFTRDSHDLEAWLTVAVVTRIIRVAHGNLYDCHAIDTMNFVATKGKLDGNEKLFKVMSSSVHPTPEFSTYSNHWISYYYQIYAQNVAKIDQVYANTQNEITQMWMQVSAHAQQVSEQGFRATDQGLRGVQTFLDPTTGRKFEMSDQYGHAWMNGAGQYVMSDDPNFNPGSEFSGSWNQLQPVQP
jgi:Cysteine rich repeat